MNNKGRFQNNESKGQKFKSFMKESGFYIAIVLGLCVLAAGAVYFSTNQILKNPEVEPPIAGNDFREDEFNLGLSEIPDPFEKTPDQSSIEFGAKNADDDPLIGMGDSDNDSESAQNQVDGEDNNLSDAVEKDLDETNQDKKDKDTNAPDHDAISTGGETDFLDNSATEDVVFAIVRPAFKVPVKGKIQTEYSMDKLVFSPTFNEWRTHSGVDISAPHGEVVRSIGDGTVSEIKNDPRFGFTVVVDHNNGYKSIYSNLASDQAIQVGQELKIGDPIGAVGTTAIFESAEPTHLHFELYKENKLVDPVSYIDFN